MNELMKRIRTLRLLAVLALLGFISGCATADEDSVSSRPWNAPNGWENGLPPSFYEGR